MRKLLHKQDFTVLEKVMEDKKLIIWGYRKNYPFLDGVSIDYVVDRNDELCDRKGINGVTIYLPEILYSENVDEVVILIATPEKYYSEITKFLDNLSINNVFYMNVIENEFLKAISSELYDSMGKITEVCKLLNDALSMKIYKEVIHRRICGCVTGYSDLKVMGEVQYIFPPALFSKPGGVIIDCGGYTGDSIERFRSVLGFGCIDKMYTFEALPENLNLLNNLKDSYGKDGNKICIIPAAVSGKTGTVTFTETEKKGASHIAGKKISDKYTKKKPVSQIDVRCVSIDETIPNGETVRYIKMDIEGSEYDALIGAKKTIRREKPGLAISIYHNAEDYYRLALLIKRFVPEYKLAVRHHKDKHQDTVLYAWI